MKLLPSQIINSLNEYIQVYQEAKHLEGKSRDITCEFDGCEKSFKQKEVMKTHLKLVHLKEFSLCNICGDSVRNMNYHLQSCNKESISKHFCEICSKAFSCKKSLETHIETIHGENTTTLCPVCSKEVKNLKSHHVLAHSEEDLIKHPCEKPGCDALFRNKQNAKKHYKVIHLGKKEQCTICNEWQKSLHSHMMVTHQLGKKHMCNECGKVFYKNCDLKVHIEKIHNQKGRRYTCPECGKTVSKIKEHMKSIHGLDIESRYIEAFRPLASI